MSFRVWFLRMVWIVAAAVALSGCPDDEKKDNGNDNGNGNDGNGDGPSLAVAADPATIAQGGTVKVTATIAGQTDDAAKVKVTLSVKCGESSDDLVAADGNEKEITGNASADWTVTAPGKDGDCDIKATAEGFDDATGKFTVGEAADDGGGNAVSITWPSDPIEDTATPGKIVVNFAHTNIATADNGNFKLHYACLGAAAGTAPADKDAVSGLTGAAEMACGDGATNTCEITGQDNKHCYLVIVNGSAESDVKYVDTNTN